MDVVTGAADVAPHDFSKDRKQLPQEFLIAGRGEILAHGFEVPQRCVHRVVFGSLTGIGEAVGEHPAIHEPGKRA